MLGDVCHGMGGHSTCAVGNRTTVECDLSTCMRSTTTYSTHVSAIIILYGVFYRGYQYCNFSLCYSPVLIHAKRGNPFSTFWDKSI